MSAAVEWRVFCAVSKPRASEANLSQLRNECSGGAGFRYSPPRAPAAHPVTHEKLGGRYCGRTLQSPAPGSTRARP